MTIATLEGIHFIEDNLQVVHSHLAARDHFLNKGFGVVYSDLQYNLEGWFMLLPFGDLSKYHRARTSVPLYCHSESVPLFTGGRGEEMGNSFDSKKREIHLMTPN